MGVYTPDNWVVIKFPDHYRLLVGWSGGYTTSDSWRMNSGITSVVKYSKNDPHWLFKGSSGSIYNCHKDAYHLRVNTVYVWQQLLNRYEDKVSIMDEDTNWLEVDWLIGG